jgi:hypothetical protein
MPVVIAHGAAGPLDEILEVVLAVALTVTWTLVTRGLRRTESEDQDAEVKER